MSGNEVARVTQKEVGLAALAIFAAGAAMPTVVSRLRMWLKPGGKFSGLNSATAGARTTKELPVGQAKLQLYSLGSPNGQKVTCMLEELGLPYDAWYIDIMKGDQFTSGFVAINPNSKIPAMVDHAGLGGKPLRIFESASILLYLAEKTGKLMPKDPAVRTECLNWLFFQVGAAPFFGQYGHFAVYAPTTIAYGVNRYAMETQRVLSVLDQHLKGKDYLVGDELTIADIAWMPWVRALTTSYKADDKLSLSSYVNVCRWRDALLARPTIAKGMRINLPQIPELQEYHSAGSAQ